ncbi:MAG TPA: hypothetical protein VHX17_08000 [Candidatus Cybelea sp.]|jgi:hypothetical protein|nr:hypothetical protein [Candidatus Cybelea sp.]
MTRKAFAILAGCLIALTARAAADCRVHKGEHVVLYSTTDDPSVLMWDSRARLRAYHAATFDVAQALSAHALLAPPGTHADVISCIPDYVTSPLFTAPADAVGIVVTTGPMRGAARWVLGSDVRTVKKR